MSWYGKPLKPESREEIELAETCDGMRTLLNRYSHDDFLTRRVFDMAAYRGLSGEDKYVTLAYHALLQLEHYRDLAVRGLEFSPMAPIFVPADGLTLKTKS